jgi:glycosyltransferase involved in cell wall biosynthesis
MGQADDPLRILASSVALGSSGGITVLEGLGGALARRDDVVIRFAIPAGLAARVEDYIPRPVLLPVSLPSVPARLRWEEMRSSQAARDMRADFLFGMTNTLPVVRSLGGARGALLIQNIAPLLPEIRGMYRRAERARFEALRFLTLRSVRRADITFLFTRYGRDLVSSLVPRAHVVTIPPGGLPPIQVPDEPRTVGDHVLVLADLYRYKGVEQVIGALADQRLKDLRLIVAGAPMEPAYARMLREIAVAAGVTDRVWFVGRIPRVEVIELLRTARCLVQPSHVESLALPMLEALQLGVPVVSTDIPVARELCGEAASYFAGNDVHGLAEALVQVPEKPPAGAPATLDWDASASAVVSELRSVMRSGSVSRKPFAHDGP